MSLAGPLLLAAPAFAESTSGDAKRGAPVYRPCAACHSLRRGVHLTGPSLAGQWGARAASVAEFGRYSDALRAADMVWDADTLDAWLAAPETLVPGTSMTFRGIEDAEKRADLIAFLGQAMAPGGADAVVRQGLISEKLAAGRAPPVLTEVVPSRRVTAIRHCGDGYYLTMADGSKHTVWETNLRLKVDTSARGPAKGSPVLLRSGMGGDRFSVVFSRVSEIGEFIRPKC